MHTKEEEEEEKNIHTLTQALKLKNKLFSIWIQSKQTEMRWLFFFWF